MPIINRVRKFKVKRVNGVVKTGLAVCLCWLLTVVVQADELTLAAFDTYVENVFIAQGYTESGIHYCDELVFEFRPQQPGAYKKLVTLMLAVYQADSTKIVFLARYYVKNEQGELTSFCIDEGVLPNAKLHFVFQSKPRNAGSLGDLLVKYDEKIFADLTGVLKHYSSKALKKAE